MLEALGLTVSQVLIAFLSFVVGFFTRSFTYTAKERADVNQVKFSNARDLAALQHQRFDELMAIFSTYALRVGKPTMMEFAAISRAAQNFLYQQQLIADAILSGRVDTVSRDSTLLPNIIETAERVIPKIYETLQEIAEENGIAYPVEFRRENYENIYAVVEKFGGAIRRGGND